MGMAFINITDDLGKWMPGIVEFLNDLHEERKFIEIGVDRIKKSTCICISYIDGKISGLIGVEPWKCFSANYIMIGAMYQGKGIGNKLQLMILKEARCSIQICIVQSDNSAARKMCERIGYRTLLKRKRAVYFAVPTDAIGHIILYVLKAVCIPIALLRL